MGLPSLRQHKQTRQLVFSHMDHRARSDFKAYNRECTYLVDTVSSNHKGLALKGL
jgi:hypothetical protein